MTMSQPCEELLPGDLGEIDDLLRAVVADGFTVYLCGGSDSPEAIVATYAWENHVDYVVIKDAHDVTAARSRQVRDWDVFTAESVVWSYHGHARWALRAILDLLPPDHPQAPDDEYPAPASLQVDESYLRKVSVRSPRPGLVARRAMRLRTATYGCRIG
ncbi:hypothetical protein SAMN05192558_111238 [Actinokineospora alba]|uniref:Uncharacterized protein n=2 Tax=Actinokineospora alba TaxID=504798 RepID=A0A1H0UIY5_9PSEU|nr:hypothetical protein C8E96_0520 [Actinokineospora alba]SDH52590.1 hypothetical protein SAMN05421871_101343 [Actinokineospora alba]SDP66262.1 hypothetical protein SAMN05192558_111238 [Actinokineospora alba]